ncbi:MAG: radical SAM/SPASM domain-containing protein [Paludibacteraceae bacterium]
MTTIRFFRCIFAVLIANFMPLHHFFSTLTAKKINNLLKNRVSYLRARITKNAKISGMPVTLSVEPAAVCQLHCPECVLGAGHLKRNTKFLSFDLYKKIIDETADTLCYLMLYFQGEPFLAPDMYDMIAYAHQKNIYTATSTNAQNIDAAAAIQICQSGLNKIIISLDGITQNTYAKYRIGGNINRVFDAINHINNAKKRLQVSTPDIELQFIVFRHNEHEIPLFKRKAQTLGVQKITIKTAQIYNYANKQALLPTSKRYSRYIIKNGVVQPKYKTGNHCLRQWQGGVVTANGAFVPCCFDKNADFLFGNVHSANITTLWNSESARRFRQQILQARHRIAVCIDCIE